MADIPDLTALQTTATENRKRKFPDVQEQGSEVYNTETRVFRDNSRFVTEELVPKTNVLFVRPPQLGKTTLWSLAELLLSNTQTAPTGLNSYPPDLVKNSWYVVRIDFGHVSYVGNARKEEWEKRAEDVNNQIRRCVSDDVDAFLSNHQGIKKIYDTKFAEDLHAGEMVKNLASAIAAIEGTRDDSNTKPTLLLLVDEYDKPIRDILFDFISKPKIDKVRDRMKDAFSQYVAFFNAIKHSNHLRVKVKAWVTGITPVGLTLISGFLPNDITFHPKMADAIGLLKSDVKEMVGAAITSTSYDKEEEEQKVLDQLKTQFNNLRFPGGSPLFHTGMMNKAMNILQESETRQAWLDTITNTRAGQEVPSSAFNVIERAGTSKLRALVSRLVDQQTVTGYSYDVDMSLTSLLDQGSLTEDQYLTLLLHLGIVSVEKVSKNGVEKNEFKSTSEVYRKKHLEALNMALASSIAGLLDLNTKESMYKSGECILLDFLHALSMSRMAALIAWAGERDKNRILELQLQGSIVSQLYESFKSVPESVDTTQEDKLQARRSDVTITTKEFIVVLELKKKDTSQPTEKEWIDYHTQLRGYVTERRSKETGSGGRWVAGFVLVMYDGGKRYAVRKLADDDE